MGKRTKLSLVIENEDGISDKDMNRIKKSVLEVLKKELPSWDWDD